MHRISMWSWEASVRRTQAAVLDASSSITWQSRCRSTPWQASASSALAWRSWVIGLSWVSSMPWSLKFATWLSSAGLSQLCTSESQPASIEAYCALNRSSWKLCWREPAYSLRSERKLGIPKGFCQSRNRLARWTGQGPIRHVKSAWGLLPHALVVSRYPLILHLCWELELSLKKLWTQDYGSSPLWLLNQS